MPFGGVAATFFLSYFLVRLVMYAAPYIGFVDIPNVRSFHKSVMPRSGGIGFFLAFFAGFYTFERNFFLDNWFIMAAIAIIFATGIVDDKFHLSAKVKFLMMFVATLLLWYYGIAIWDVGNWFGFDGRLPVVVVILFSMFAFSGFTNAINLMDGLDGLASVVSGVILLAFLAIGVFFEEGAIVRIASYMLGALAAFWLLNRYPAKVFMGDGGSLTLGFVISVLGVLAISHIHPITILYFGAVPILDTIIVMIRRHKNGLSPFDPDKTHMHHLLYERYRDINEVVAILVAAQLFFIFMGFAWNYIIALDPYKVTPLVALIVFVLIYKYFYGYFTKMLMQQVKDL